ncbi:MAG: hypothetical protein V1720_05475 [bacterium]
MTSIQSEILSTTDGLAEEFLFSLLEYARYMKELSEKGEQTDMEYFKSIPGLIDSIKESADTELKNCTDKLEW